MRTSRYERDGDIEQEGTEEVDGIESGGDGQDEGQGRAAELPNRSLRHMTELLAACRKERARALADGNRGTNPTFLSSCFLHELADSLPLSVQYRRPAFRGKRKCINR